MKRVAVLVRWLKTWADTVGSWWGIMSGALSIPFAFLALFNFQARLLFAALAYIALWVVIVGQARRISELQKPVPSPDVIVHVGRDLLAFGHDFDVDSAAWRVRGRIKNIGDRAVKHCRLKLLKVEGQNLPPEAKQVRNGFLQWQGGIRDSMTLNPSEEWIFDIGTRRPTPYCQQLRLCAYFVTGGPLIDCYLEAPGTYTLTIGIYGEDLRSTERTVCIRVGEEPRDIEFPPS
jgi:hypothetical protein